jgi:alpha-mannosidase
VQTWAFGFHLSAPHVWHEEVGAIIRARLLTGGGHADCYYFRLGASSPTNLDTTTPQILVLAGGQVDGPNLDIVNQDGDSYFLQHFALQTHGAFDAANAMRFALEHQNPLVTGIISNGTVYPEDKHSLLSLSNTNVLLWALKPAEEGITNGIIARVWNLAAGPQRFSLSLAAGIAEAKPTTHVETDLADVRAVGGTLAASAAPSQLRTFRVVPEVRRPK